MAGETPALQSSDIDATIQNLFERPLFFIRKYLTNAKKPVG
jgi:hypothetical protein